MNTADDPGLRSIEQRVHAEHRELAQVLARVRAGLGRGGDVEEAAKMFARLRDGFEAHIAQEEQLYYPPIWALLPEHKSALLGFIAVHDRFRGLLDGIEDHLRHRRSEAAEEALNALTLEFADHERGEEHLLRRVTDELSAHPD